MILSIVIPTFNRARILDANLKSILLDSGGLRVKVYVSDNCSDDDTQLVLSKLASLNENLHYKKNSVNLGFDRNILSLINWVEGDYIWFLGDDDYLTEGALCRVLESICREQADAFILNGMCRSGHKELKSDLSSKTYSDIDLFTGELWVHLTWMSSLVVRRELLVGFDGERFVDTHFMHVHALYYALSKSKSLNVLYDNRVFVTYPDSTDILNSYTKNTLFLFLNRWFLSIEMLPDFVGQAVRDRCMRNSVINKKVLFSLRGKRLYSLADYSAYRAYFEKIKLKKWAFLAAIAPVSFCRLLILVYRELLK